MDCSPPGSSVHGILQARILEWVAISFSRAFSRPKDRTQVSCIAGRCFISIITLNVNGLNAPAKRHRLAEWIQNQDPYICCLQETHFRPQDICRLKVRGWKNIFHENGKQKKAGVAILISDKRP